MTNENIEEVIVYVDGDSAKCTGENNDHPLVFLASVKKIIKAWTAFWETPKIIPSNKEEHNLINKPAAG